jgi:hypothetical protein
VKRQPQVAFAVGEALPLDLTDADTQVLGQAVGEGTPDLCNPLLIPIE